MGLGIPPLTIKIMLESNHLNSIMLVRRLAVARILLTRHWPIQAMTKSLSGLWRTLADTCRGAILAQAQSVLASSGVANGAWPRLEKHIKRCIDSYCCTTYHMVMTQGQDGGKQLPARSMILSLLSWGQQL